jgi:hypothetical protein
MNLGISQTYQNEVIKNEEKGVQDMDCKCNHLRKGISGLGIRQEGVVRTGANQKAQPLYTRSRPIRPCLVLVMQKTKQKQKHVFHILTVLRRILTFWILRCWQEIRTFKNIEWPK